MKISMSFEFDSIEEMKIVADKLAGSEAVQTFASAPVVKDVESAKEVEAKPASRSRASKPAEKPAQAQPAEATTVNPFEGMPQVVQAEPPKTKPESRESLLAEVTEAINGWTAAKIEMAEIAKTFNERFFMPAGIPQCKLSNLDDASLLKFVQVFRTSIKSHIDGMKNSGALV